MTAAALASGPASRRPEKENMTDFLAKKREIFLVQMSLDTKRAEITKLEERALQASSTIPHITLGSALVGIASSAAKAVRLALLLASLCAR